MKTSITKTLIPLFSFSILLYTSYFLPFSASAATINAPSTSLTSGSSLTSGLVGHWTLDGKDTPNGVAKDLSGQGNTGNLFNIATSTFYSTGKLGQAFSFDGSDDYIDAGTGSALNPSTGSFTIGGWYKTSATSQITLHDKNCASSNNGYVARMESTGLLTVAFMNSTTVRRDVSSSVAVNDGKWHNIMMVLDRSSSPDDARVYIDGVDQSTSKSGTLDGQSVSDANSLWIGRMRTTCSGGGFWNGSIDDPRVYNRALTAAEIKQLYQLGGGQVNASSVLLGNGSSFTSGLVGHWTFDGKDTPNGVAKDLSGQGNTGNLFNIATSTFYSAGKLGQAFNFDGSNDYMSVGSPSVLNMTGSETVSAWVKTNTSTYQTIYSQMSNSNNLGEIQFRIANTRILQFFRRNSQGASSVLLLAGNGVLSTGQWYHVVAVYDGTNYTIYINGVSDATSTGSASNYNGGGTADTKIGALAGPDNQMNGLIDDLRVYSRVLTAAEIKQLYQLGGGTANASSAQLTTGSSLTSGLVGHWTFDGKDVISGKVKDRSGQGNDGSPSGIATSTFYSLGKLGQAFNFDGSNDYIVIGDVTALKITGAVTVSAWIKTTATAGLIYSKYAGGNGATSPYVDMSSGKIRLYTGVGPSWTNRVSAVTVNDGKWHFITTVFAPSANTDIYIDGVLSNGTLTGSIVSALTDTTAQAVIGCADGCSSNSWNGLIDDVRVYNRALTAAEIKQLYLMGK